MPQRGTMAIGVLVGAAALGGASLIFQAQGPSQAPTPPEKTITTDGNDMGPTADVEHTNRLINETSPYLLQHAHNPVDWYAWGPEAFEEARRRQVPILVSIGYSTCYWCHVMERESFENEAIAALMNKRLVCIKVDREERPDVDDIYMAAVVAMTGQGGWPMNVFLTPPAPEGIPAAQAWIGLQPFWGGTYFPPEDAYGRPGWSSVVEGISDLWAKQQADVLQQARGLSRAIEQQMSQRRAAMAVSPEIVGRAMGHLLRIADRMNGGFGQAPKFPQPSLVTLLMDGRDSIGDESQRTFADEMLGLTLDRMAMGGMYDQIGGGFHRYSTDAQWLVPHFEKMLYGNGQLAALYAYAAESADDAYYARIAGQICDYVLREMMDPKTGAFYSAQDAEVNHREGQNYLWTPDQVRQALKNAGQESLIGFALEAYGLDGGPNFQDPHHADEPRSNVVYLVRHPQRLAEEAGVPVEEIYQRLDRINAALLPVRDQRDQPGTDDKVIAGWNGLMIGGLAEVGRVLGREDLLIAADRAWVFIDEHMRDADGGLLRSYRAGSAKTNAFCEDYAYVAKGLIALHGATGQQRYLDAAIGLMDQADKRFGDARFGGYFDTLADQDDLLVRSRSTHDGAVPSANGVMLNNLIALYTLTGDERFADKAQATTGAMSFEMNQNPLAAVNAVRGLLLFIGAAPDRVAQIGTDLGPMFDPADGPVHFDVAKQTIALADGESGTITVEMTIDEPYHVNAHEPGVEGLAGLDVVIMEGTGFAVSVEYPRGTPFGVSGDEVMVYSGQMTIEINVDRTGEVKGMPRIVILYQACTEIACLEAATFDVPVLLQK